MNPEQQTKIERLRDQRHPGLMDNAFNELVDIAAEHYPAYLASRSNIQEIMFNATQAFVAASIEQNKKEVRNQVIGMAALDSALIYFGVSPWITIPFAVYTLSYVGKYAKLHLAVAVLPVTNEELRNKIVERKKDTLFVMEAVQTHPLYDPDTTMTDVAARYNAKLGSLTDEVSPNDNSI